MLVMELIMHIFVALFICFRTRFVCLLNNFTEVYSYLWMAVYMKQTTYTSYITNQVLNTSPFPSFIIYKFVIPVRFPAFWWQGRKGPLAGKRSLAAHDMGARQKV